MTIPLENLEEMAKGFTLQELAVIAEESADDWDPTHVEWWDEEEELVLHYPKDAKMSTIIWIFARMTNAGIVEEVAVHDDGDAECIRLRDVR